MREDRYTNTEADAAAYERQRARDEYDDDRPSLADLAEEYDAEWDDEDVDGLIEPAVCHHGSDAGCKECSSNQR